MGREEKRREEKRREEKRREVTQNVNLNLGVSFKHLPLTKRRMRAGIYSTRLGVFQLDLEPKNASKNVRNKSVSQPCAVAGHWTIKLGRPNARLLHWSECSCASAKTKVWRL